MMFADCPACEREFRVRARQLRAAGGLVKCGYCGETFNALARLHDKPLKRATHPVSNHPALEAEPTFTLPDRGAATGGEEQSRQMRRSAARPPGDAHKGAQVLGDIEESSQAEAIAAFDFPHQGGVEQSRPATLASRLMWSFFMLILILGGTIQLIWFNRDGLLREYPQLQPWAQRICLKLACDLIRFRDVSAIKLVNRDVRLHPRYQELLLVNATIVNQARFTQPYPQIQLSIFDTNGELISYRQFAPGDYLEQGLLDLSAMAPNEPVHFVLELAGATKEAVSFEFGFM